MTERAKSLNSISIQDPDDGSGIRDKSVTPVDKILTHSSAWLKNVFISEVEPIDPQYQIYKKTVFDIFEDTILKAFQKSVGQTSKEISTWESKFRFGLIEWFSQIRQNTQFSAKHDLMLCCSTAIKILQDNKWQKPSDVQDSFKKIGTVFLIKK